MQENNYLPSMTFYYRNPYSKLFLCRTFLFVDRFSKFLQSILGQTTQDFEKKIVYLKLIRNICENPLSETRKHTLSHKSKHQAC